jgi:hypothetical protein
MLHSVALLKQLMKRRLRVVKTVSIRDLLWTSLSLGMPDLAIYFEPSSRVKNNGLE